MADMDLQQIRIYAIMCVVVLSTCMEAQALVGAEVFVSISSVAIPHKCAVDLVFWFWSSHVGREAILHPSSHRLSAMRSRTVSSLHGSD